MGFLAASEAAHDKRQQVTYPGRAISPCRVSTYALPMKLLITLSALLAVGLTTTACHEGPAEKAGRNIDQAASKAGHAIENAGDKVRDAAK
jgi:hypothetical protein